MYQSVSIRSECALILSLVQRTLQLCPQINTSGDDVHVPNHFELLSHTKQHPLYTTVSKHFLEVKWEES